MNQQLQQIYNDARRIEAELIRDHAAGKYPDQPAAVEIVNAETGDLEKKPAFWWATSLRNLQFGTTAGDGRVGTCLMPLAMLAYRMAILTHRPATREEIERNLEHQRKNRIEAQAADAKAAKRFEIALPGS